jgi:hypothetical protein
MTKICSKCGRELPIDDFYKHPQMLDSHLNQCKECVKSRVKIHRTENKEYFKEYEFNRNRTVKRREWKKKYVKNSEINKKNREKKRISLKNKRRSDKRYQQCHNALDRAVQKGEITRPDFCQVCGKKAIVIGHHCDYSKPLNVVWLCNTCHGLYHSSNAELASKIQEAVKLLFEIGLKNIG